MMLRKLLLSLLVTSLIAAPALAGYTLPGTFVVKTQQFGTVVDNGGVVCLGVNGDGIGGGCLLFPKFQSAGFVKVNDDTVGERVAFQVCLDNNGDGICGGPQLNEQCRDQIFFSHADGSVFHNALGPLPTSLLRGCESNGGFPGYVVLLCTGEHEDRRDGTHTHTLTSGTIALVDKGTGYGDFCGGGGEGGSANGFEDAVAKAYVRA